MPPSSDKQFLALMLLRIWKGDQVTSTEESRLRLLAEQGYSGVAYSALDAEVEAERI